MKKDSQYGKNNFDRLEAAGLVAGPDDSENLKAKTEARVQALTKLVAKLKKVETFLATLHVIEKPRQLKRLNEASAALRTILGEKLPVGAKRHVEACVNEVISLKEGIYASNTRFDQQTLALTASAKARDELEAMVQSAELRLEKVQADATDDLGMEEFFDKAKAIIEKNAHEAAKLEPIGDKPFVIARAPVVPSDRSLQTDKLPQLGFKSESIAGYAVIHNQIVLGINAKYLASHDRGANADIADMHRKLKEADLTIEEVKRAAVKLKEALSDLSKVDKEQADPVFLQKKEDEVTKRQTELKHMIDKIGFDPSVLLKLEKDSKQSHNALPQAIKDEAERLRKLLERKTNQKLQFVTARPSPYKAGTWFWLMPERDLNNLAKAFPAKRVSISHWGFAFPGK